MRNTFAKVVSFPLVLALALILPSCKGDTGPAGPAGPAGADGEDAEFSIITISFTGEDAGISGSNSFYDVSVPEMTQDIVDNGCVVVYINDAMSDTPDSGWILMPFILSISGESIMFSFMYELGQVTFAYFASEPTWPYSSTTWYHYKIVMFKGIVPNQLNLNSFEEVERYCQKKQREMQ